MIKNTILGGGSGSGSGAVLVSPSGDTTGVADVNNLNAAFTNNPNGTVVLKAGATYYLNNKVSLLNQTLIGNGATIQRVAQTTTTTSTTITANNNLLVTVASTSGFYAGQGVIFSVAGNTPPNVSNNFAYGVINSVNTGANQLDVAVSASGITGTVSGAGTIVANSCILFSMNSTAGGDNKSTIRDLTIRGLSGSDSWATNGGVSTTQKWSRWEVTTDIRSQGRNFVENVYFVETAGEGIQESASQGSTMVDWGAAGFTLSSATGNNTNRVVFTTSVAHGLSKGAAVYLAGHTTTAINGAWAITDVGSATTFEIQIGSQVGACTLGGTVSIAFQSNQFKVNTGDGTKFRAGQWVTLAYLTADATAIYRDQGFSQVTAVSGDTITIAKTFTYGLSTNVGTINVYIANDGCRYTNNVYNNVGGNAVHFSGSQSSLFANNSVSGANKNTVFLQTGAHMEGIVTWSDWCMNTRVEGNFLSSTSKAAFGNCRVGDQSGMVILNNTMQDCNGNLVDMIYGNTANIKFLTYIGNHSTDCGAFKIYSNNSITTGNASSIVISGNTFIGTPPTVAGNEYDDAVLSIYFGRNISITDNVFDYFYPYVPQTHQRAIYVYCGNGVTIQNNTILGYMKGVESNHGNNATENAFAGFVTVKNNNISYFRQRGIHFSGMTGTAPLLYGNIAEGNTITDLCISTTTGITQGFKPAIQYAPSDTGGYSAIYLNSPKTIAKGNVINCSAVGMRAVRCDVASIANGNCIIDGNVLIKYGGSNGNVDLTGTTANSIIVQRTTYINGGTTSGVAPNLALTAENVYNISVP